MVDGKAVTYIGTPMYVFVLFVFDVWCWKLMD